LTNHTLLAGAMICAVKNFRLMTVGMSVYGRISLKSFKQYIKSNGECASH